MVLDLFPVEFAGANLLEMKASGEVTVSFLAGDQVHIGQYFSYPGRKFHYIAPEYLAEHPISRLDMDRLRLFRVTAYTIRSTGVYDEGMTARQVVEIKMFNANQAVERTIIDEQEWRYHENLKRWLLHSGLPDPTKRY